MTINTKGAAVVLEVRAQDFGPDQTGFILARPISNRKVKLYFEDDIAQIVSDLSELDINPEYKTRQFWEERLNHCTFVLSIVKVLRKGVPKKKQRASNKYEGRFSRHCAGRCQITGYTCKIVRDIHVGFMCRCLP